MKNIGNYFISQKDMVKITSSKKVKKIFDKNDGNNYDN